jgi:hypothetical protein
LAHLLSRVLPPSLSLSCLGPQPQHPIIHALVSPVQILEKVRLDTLCQTCPFAFGAIYGSRGKFWKIRGTNLLRNIFDARVGPVRIP